MSKIGAMLFSISDHMYPNMKYSNRYSMPVTSSMNRKRESVPDYSSIMGVGHINTTGFLFGDDDEKVKESATSPDVKTYLQMNTTDDKFPILIRNNHHPGLVSSGLKKTPSRDTDGFRQLSASSAALDLALSQSPGPDSQTNGWTPFARHRPSQQSLPQNVFDNPQGVDSPTSGSQQSVDTITESPTNIRQLNRRSLEASLAAYGKSLSGQNLANGNSARPNLASLQMSYSTNDIPTLKNTNGLATAISPPKPNPQQQFHNHNASLGRIPTHAVNKRMSREVPTISEARQDEPSSGVKQIHSELQASAAPFGPTMSAASVSDSSQVDHISSIMATPSMPQYATQAFYGGYGMQLMNMGMSPLQMNSPMGFNPQMSMYQNPYPPYPQYPQQARFPDSQARVIQQRRLQNVEGTNLASIGPHLNTDPILDVARFTNTKIENYQGDIYALCKDQHGCRYLQKQLEGRDPETIHLIFMETNQHVVELMTGIANLKKALNYNTKCLRSFWQLPVSKVIGILER